MPDEISFEVRMFSVQEADSSYDKQIERFLLKSPSATFYHLPLWLDVLQKESGQKGIKLICFDEDENIIGYLPLLFTRGLPVGIGGVLASRRLSSLPRTPIAGPVSDNLNVKKALIEYAIKLVVKERNSTLQIKSTSGDCSSLIENLKSFPWREIYYKEIPPLPHKINFSSSKVEKEVLRALRRAEENGVIARYGSTIDDLKKWYKFYLETMQYHATPARSFKFFENLWKEFYTINQMRLNLVEQIEGRSSKILTGSITFKFKNTTYGAFKGSNRKKMKHAVNDILHHFEFTQAQKEGFRIFDMGEVPKNHKGLEFYKQKWGMQSYMLYHYYAPPLLELSEEILDPGNAGSLKKKLWRLIPLRITQSIGKSFYKRL